jgi:hypothetical protein
MWHSFMVWLDTSLVPVGIALGSLAAWMLASVVQAGRARRR